MNMSSEVSTESRFVSKREIALGLLSKSTYNGDYSCERFLNQNEEVTFQLFNGKSDFNAEFSIAGKPNRRIWLSQLNRVYLDADELELQCGVIRFKNGEQRILAGMLVNDFLEATRGRTFRVHVINGLFAIDFWDVRCRALENDTILDLLVMYKVGRNGSVWRIRFE